MFLGMLKLPLPIFLPRLIHLILETTLFLRRGRKERERWREGGREGGREGEKEGGREGEEGGMEGEKEGGSK